MRPLLAPALAAVLTITPAALGQSRSARDSSTRAPSRPREVVVARDSGDEALKLYAAGRWAEAYDTFRRANAAYHAPTLVLYMAHSKKLGRLAEARDLYQSIVDERLSPDAPAQFWRAQSAAREEIAALRPRVPAIVVTLSGDDAPRARAMLDGELLVADHRRRDLDPGEHFVEVTVDDISVYRQTVILPEGIVMPLRIAVSPPPVAPSPPVVAPMPVASAGRGPSAPVLISLGVGAGALAFGATTGVVALRQTADLVSRCQAGVRCPAVDPARAAAVARLADASTAGLIVGGAAIMTAAILYLVRPSSSPTAGRPAGTFLGITREGGSLGASF